MLTACAAAFNPKVWTYATAPRKTVFSEFALVSGITSPGAALCAAPWQDNRRESLRQGCANRRWGFTRSALYERLWRSSFAAASSANARIPRRRHSVSTCSRSSPRNLAAASTSRPRITARSSPVSSTSSALTTSPPSSMSWRVRSRRFTCHARASCRARLAKWQLRAAWFRCSAAQVAGMFAASSCASAFAAL